MTSNGSSEQRNVEAAEVVLPCAELHGTLSFFTERLGFRVDAIHPADDPAVAVISGHGIRIRLARGVAGDAGVLRLLCRDPGALADGATELVAPNGTRIVLADSHPPLVLPPVRPSFVLRSMGDAAWVEGRAGMRYRDLIPDRQGGRFIASHIQIARGGPVADYAHFHKVQFQMIYCAKGWTRVVYEDQGPPFILRAGDCVLQPPQIRHRVLESSPGLEVIEIGAPAVHETFADHDLSLPTLAVNRERDFGGQRFVRHEAAAATWRPWQVAGFEARDLGIAEGTGGLVSAHVARFRGGGETQATSHDAELRFTFVLSGSATLECDDRAASLLGEGDAFVVPPNVRHALTRCSAELELLEVTVPAGPTPQRATTPTATIK